MGEELNRSLEMLANRGIVRGATAVLDDARSEAAGGRDDRSQPSWQRGLVVAFGSAAVVLLAVGASILIARPFGGEAPTPPAVPPAVAVLPASAGSLNDINDLALAPNEDLWAATAAGLVRWDVATGGFEIMTESDGIPGRSVNNVEAAPDGTVWVAADYGIGRYDGTWHVFSDENTPELAGQLGALVVDHDGVVWATVASEPLARFDGEWTSVTAPDGPGRSVIGPDGLAVGVDGTLWAGTDDGGVFAFDGSEWRHFTGADGAPERAWHVAVAPDGAVWAWDDGYFTSPGREEFVAGTGFARYHEGSWTTYTVDDGLLSTEGYVAIAGDGSVAVVHHEWGPDHEKVFAGVSRFDGAGWTTESGADSSSYGPITATVVGADGTVWMPVSGGIRGFSGSETYELTVLAEMATPPAAAWTVVPDPEQAPIHVSTAIGNFEFTALKPSTPREIFYVAGTPFGAVIPDGNRLYWSQDYVTWSGVNLRREQPWLTTDGADLIGFGDGYTRYTWTGQGWVEGTVVDLPGDVEDIAFGPDGAVAIVDSTVYYSTNGVDFVPADGGPTAVGSGATCDEAPFAVGGDGIGPILVTDSGYVILARADAEWDRPISRLCEPLAWFSADGNLWELQTPESPFGPQAAVWDIAAFEGRFVAIGSPWDEPATSVWVSTNGIDWSQVDVPQLESVGGVAGGNLGWFLTGHHVSDGADMFSTDMWFSADGEAWHGPYSGPEGLFWAYFRDELSAGVDTFVSVNGTHDGIVIGRLEQ